MTGIETQWLFKRQSTRAFSIHPVDFHLAAAYVPAKSPSTTYANEVPDGRITEQRISAASSPAQWPST
ncbi:hypothetical protein AB0F68_07935 [Micromonospora sp. NPDC023966]|uniref:hypothetical protein n=1 Tax=Micromonospora sp. NPDC023966 TaxID=3154699 RepID=UPI0033D9F4CE